MKFKKWPIAYQLYTLAIVIIMIISIIFITSYNMISQSLIKNNIVYTSQVFNQIQSNIKDKTVLLQNLLSNCGYDENAARFIVEKDNGKRYEYQKKLQDSALEAIKIENSIHDVIIEGFNGVSTYSNGKSSEIAKVLDMLPKEPKNYYEISNNLIRSKNGDLLFVLSTSIFNVWEDEFLPLPRYVLRASFIVNMDIWGINNFVDEYDMGLFLLDDQYNICAANQKINDDTKAIFNIMKPLPSAERQEVVANGTTYIINSNYLNTIGATILSITPKSSIINSISWVKQITYYLLLIALVLIIGMFFLIKHNIVSPLKKFGKIMYEIENGSVGALKKQVDLHGYQEIEVISEQFNTMIGEIDSLTHRLVKTMGTLYDTELQKKQAELLHLKSQINPHFLFNTLEVILGISYMEEAPKTAEMIKSLSKIFKYCVRGKDTVTIAEELNIIKSYIHIQQTRFYELFEAYYEFDEEILDKQIPKMLLQPLVENAITHGLEKKGSHGNVYIGGKVNSAGKIKLWVRDDGIGLDEEKLSALKHIISKESFMRTDSIGFENVINRLQLIYGDKCDIKITSEINKGTSIELTIPCL